ncbi:MAG: hypothetical protein WCO06_00965 [Candidatus Roizmanbacteria bacterium]
MKLSITKKYLVKDLPNISNINKDTYERYYLFISKSAVIRVQKINDAYELERKVNQNDLIREGNIMQITKEEFDILKEYAKQHIIRDSYLIQENPKIVIRIYHGDFEGLKRIEVNFKTLEEANDSSPLIWFGKEITGTPLAQDGQLLQLTNEEFHSLLL